MYFQIGYTVLLRISYTAKMMEADNTVENMKLDNDFSRWDINELNGFVKLTVRQCPNQTQGQS